MGNSQSVLSHRKNNEQPQSFETPQYQSSALPKTSSPSDGVSEQSQQLAGASDVVREGNGVASPTQSTRPEKRRSLLNFASLRKTARAASVGMSDNQNQTDEGVISHPSRHHRLWRSGLRGSSRPRPTSVLVPSSSPPSSTTRTPAPRPSSAILPPSPAPTKVPNAKEKGKARDESAAPSATSMSANGSQAQSQLHGLHSPLRFDEAPPVLDSELPVAEEVPLSEQVLIELRNLQQLKQQLQDTKNDSDNGDDYTALEPAGNIITSEKDKDGDLNHVFEAARPPISPISTSPTIVPPASSSPSLVRLSDTLNSWMGGIGQLDSDQTDTTVLPNQDNTESVEPPVCQPDTCSSLSASLPETSSTRDPNNNNDGNGNNNTNAAASRTLPPTGTGTIVVVQGVVHTADVRQFPPVPPPTHHHSRSHSHRPPRTVSSTPALRNLFPGLSSSSHSPSQTRSATPQPQSMFGTSGRNRFSSFTDTLRQRSRSRTPTSTRTQNRNRSNNIAVEDYLGSGLSDHDQSSLSLGLDNTTSDSETSTSLTETSSSVGAVVSTDDTSTLASMDPTIDLSALRRVDRAGNDGTSGRNNGNSSDDDGEVELSPNSIEVLGTLLSVATAATAASLVNGTTEPLFNSSLAGRFAEDGNTIAGSSRGARSSHPSDRMRSAWDNLRDRFSRSRRRNPEGESSADVDDTREQMVREMARAFNLDLGSGGTAAGAASAEREAGLSAPSSPPDSVAAATTTTTTTTGNHEAPEGSFEQFLHNLQVDLRTALAENYAARRSGGERGEERRGEPNATSLNSQPQPDSSQFSNVHPPEPSQPRSQSQTPVVQSSSPDPTLAESSIEDPYRPRSPHSATIDLPPLPAAREMPNSNNSERRPQARAITGQPGAGINWWRLYRFPPMVMASSPPTAGANGITAASSSVSNPNPSLTGLETQPPSEPHSHIEQTAPRTESVDSATEVPQQPPPQQQQQERPQQETGDGSQHVVPVIVVGLQSVPVNRAGPLENNHLEEEAEHASDGPAEPTRGRSWPARAASSASRAFNRMGRRNEDGFTDQNQHRNHDNAEPRERHTGGGRTYLIFVIGGYYPPNHGIVTGADDMNSFEALWELAELIGQVKPQVASKEDIEQSGLEVFKASKLPEYEANHKVAFNTTERCLICLDDYEPEDDIRLLSCTHAFHRNCVDRWLEQGKNNCPACRSKGVKTSDEPAIPPT